MTQIIELLRRLIHWPGWNEPIWNALVAIGTIFLAIATLYSLRQAKRGWRLSLNREIVEKVYKPLRKRLERIIADTEELRRPSQPWGWETVRKEVIAYHLPKSFWNKAEEFQEELLRYNHCYNPDCMNALANIIVDEINKYKKSSEVSDPTNIQFEIEIGAVASRINFYKMIFWNKTLQQFLEDKAKELGVPEIKGRVLLKDSPEKARVKGWSKEDIERILHRIMTRIAEDSELQKFVEDSRNFYKKAKAINKLLEDRLKTTEIV